MSKRCEAIWQEAHKAKGATKRCRSQAERLYVTELQVHRFCEECARKYEGTATGLMMCLGVLPMNDRSNPETIKALRVRHALQQR